MGSVNKGRRKGGREVSSLYTPALLRTSSFPREACTNHLPFEHFFTKESYTNTTCRKQCVKASNEEARYTTPHRKAKSTHVSTV